jgi:hypothetical protein
MMYIQIFTHFGEREFTTEDVQAMFPDLSTSHINKNLHELIKRGWMRRIKKGRFALKNFEDIAQDMAPKGEPIDIFLELAHVGKFLITSYFASQLLTRYIHTAPRITLLAPKDEYQKIATYLKAKCKVLDNNEFQFLDSPIGVRLKPIHPLKFNRLYKNGVEVHIGDKKFVVTDPISTIEYLSKEPEERRLADIAYIKMKTPIEKREIKKFLTDAELRDVLNMERAKRGMLIQSTPMEIAEMNLVKV